MENEPFDPAGAPLAGETAPSDPEKSLREGEREPSDGVGPVFAASQGEKAWEATRAEREALPDRALVHVYAKIRDAVGQARLGALGAAKYAARLAELPLPRDLIARIDRYAGATLHADIRWVLGDRPKDDVPKLVEQLEKEVAMLRLQEETLLQRGLLRPRIHPVRKPKNTRGHLALSAEVRVLAGRMRDEWPRLEGRIHYTHDELIALVRLAEQLHGLSGMRPTRRDDRKALKLDRQRAFTLLVLAYDDLRRGLGFLLWNRETGYDAVDRVAPPLSSGVGSRWERKRREARKAKRVAEAEATRTAAATRPAAGLRSEEVQGGEAR